MELTRHALRYYTPSLKTFRWQRGSPPSYSLLIEACLCPSISEKLTFISLSNLGVVTSAIWVMLSQFPHLRKLYSRIPTTNPKGKSVVFPATHFPSLDILELFSYGRQARDFISFAVELMPVDRRPYRLRRLSLECDEPFIDGDATVIIREMVEVCDTDILETFRLNVNYYSTEDPTWEHPDIVPTSLTPLLDLPSLRELTLWPMKRIDLDNETLETMAHAWPNLETLDLPWDDKRWLQASKITLEGLIPLAQLCPRLDTVWITLGPHVSVSDELQFRVDQMTFRNSLQTLQLDRGSISDWDSAERVARFLLKLFPHLSGLLWYQDDDPCEDLEDEMGSSTRDENDGSVVGGRLSGQGNSGRNIWDLVKEIIIREFYIRRRRIVLDIVSRISRSSKR